MDAPESSREVVRQPIGARLEHALSQTSSGKSIFRLVVAGLLGVVAAYGSIFFRLVIKFVNRLAFPSGAGLDSLRKLAPLHRILPPMLGGAIVGPLVHFLAREAKGRGVPEVKLACANNSGRIRPRVALAKILASGTTIGTGGSVGREGPIVQIGSALGSGVGQLLAIRGRYLVDMVASGAAAGIAATFNAPIAGVIFALEVILGRSTARHFSPLVVSTVVATVIARQHLGDAPAFKVPAYTLVSGMELGLYVILGALAAVVGALFIHSLDYMERLWERAPIPPYTLAAVGGALVGTVAVWCPEVLGVGYEAIEQILGTTHASLGTAALPYAGGLLILMFLKMFATDITLASGGSGGVFAPSLFLGACLGGAFGSVAGQLLPTNRVANPGAYALVGMGAVVSATTHAPITAILIVFELTDRHTIILPLMLSCVLATIIATRLCPESIYTMKMKRRGVRMNKQSPDDVHSLPLVNLLSPAAGTVHPNTPLNVIAQRATEQHCTHLYVVDHRRHLIGVVTMEDLLGHLHDDEHVLRKLRARDLMHFPAAIVTSDELVEECLDIFKSRRFEEVPVVDDENRLLGRISRRDLVTYFSTEQREREAIVSFADDEIDSTQELVHLPPNEVKREVPVAGILLGETLKTLDLRARFGISAYALRLANGELKIPDPEESLCEGQSVLVAGPEVEVDRLVQRCGPDAQDLWSTET
jgi:chloride channel protein, CIC family